MSISRMRRRRPAMLLLGLLLMAPSALADVSAATITSSPAPIYKGKAFEITITTKDLGSPVYLYTWAEGGSDKIRPTDWDDAMTDSHKMSGSNGTYTIKITDFYGFYNSNAESFKNMTKLGFIARTSSKQTADCFVSLTDLIFSGEGTESSPFLIENADHLNKLAATPDLWGQGYYYRLTTDLSLTGTFDGVGSLDKPFRANFDGGNHVITNVTITNSASGISATGFFNAIDGARISGLGLKNAKVTGTTYTGALVGYAKSGIVERCFTSGTVTGTTLAVGGLMGENHAAAIDNCYSTAKVSADNAYAAGGLVGKNDTNASVDHAYASGHVSGKNYVGGVVGANYGSISASVAMNQSIAAADGSNFVARFGGNNNGYNFQQSNLGYRNMTLEENEWGNFGHHASTETDLTAKTTYKNLRWDFDNVWRWQESGDRQYPVLAVMSGQSDPNPQLTAISKTVADPAAALHVYPTVTDGTVNAECADGIALLRLHSLSGASVINISANSATSVTADCSALAPGIYFMTVVRADGTQSVVKIIRK